MSLWVSRPWAPSQERPCGSRSTRLPKSSRRRDLGLSDDLAKTRRSRGRLDRHRSQIATTPPPRAESRRRESKYDIAEGDDPSVPALSTYSTSTSDLVTVFFSSFGRSGIRARLLPSCDSSFTNCASDRARARLVVMDRRPEQTKTPANAEKKARESVILTLHYLFLPLLAIFAHRSFAYIAPIAQCLALFRRVYFTTILGTLPLAAPRLNSTPRNVPPVRPQPRRHLHLSPLAVPSIQFTPSDETLRHAPRHPGHFPRHSAPEAGHDVLGYARSGGPHHLQKVYAERACTISRVFSVSLFSSSAREELN